MAAKTEEQADTLERSRISVPEAAERTSFSPDVFYRAIARGEIEATRAGRSVRMYRDSLEAWLRLRDTAAGG
jgi:excisionase family DNA binding protein